MFSCKSIFQFCLKKWSLLAVLFILCFGLAYTFAFEQSQNHVHTFKTLEESRDVADKNALSNAETWRSELYKDYKIVSLGDATQTKACPQGSGWANVDLVSPDMVNVIHLKCSTTSARIGCLESSDFKNQRPLDQSSVCHSQFLASYPK